MSWVSTKREKLNRLVKVSLSGYYDIRNIITLKVNCIILNKILWQKEQSWTKQSLDTQNVEYHNEAHEDYKSFIWKREKFLSCA